jgi:hypothetical protein
MAKLGRDPQVVQLARSLDLTVRGDCVAEIERYVLSRVARIVAGSPIRVDSLGMLMLLLEDALSVKIEYIDSDTDIQRLAEEFGRACRNLPAQLHEDFIAGESEGLLLALPEAQPWERQYLAVVDRRGEQGARAYFTSWHELAHVLTAPHQLTLAGLRRFQPAEHSKPKDPIEQLTDQVAGLLAFYEPLFRPVFEREVGNTPLTFDAIERVRSVAAPTASFQATAMACVRLSPYPTLFLKVEPRLRAVEARQLRSPQLHFGMLDGFVPPEAKLRAIQCIPNEAAQNSGLRIFTNMRVPEQSVLMRVWESAFETEEAAVEDQSFWTASSSGRLPSLPISVRGIRRGRHVYGMVLIENSLF